MGSALWSKPPDVNDADSSTRTGGFSSGDPERVAGEGRTARRSPGLRAAAAGCAAGLAFGAVLLLFAPEVRESVLIFLPDGIAHVEAAPQEPPAVPVRTGGRGVESLTSRLQSRIPLQPYLIISTTDNTFRLMAGQMVIREGVASTGSYIRLETERGDRWTFHTPRGQFRIQGKVKNPVWIRPDWSFVEEGRPVPPANAPERYERGVLGDFALSIGNGYLIHGTLYQRLLGLPVTHGCVRLGDDDLEAVYGALDIGSSVYIY